MRTIISLFAFSCMSMLNLRLMADFTTFESNIRELQTARFAHASAAAKNSFVPIADSEEQTRGFAVKCISPDFSVHATYSAASSGVGANIGRLFSTAAGITNVFTSWVTHRIQRPLYWVSSGYQKVDSPDLSAVREFVKANILKRKGGRYRVSATSAPLGTNVVVRSAFSGKTYPTPFDSNFIVFIDDNFGGNWSHPCRYVFVKGDLSAFAVWYVADPIRVSLGDETIDLATLIDNAGLLGVASAQDVVKAVQALNANSFSSNALKFSGDTSHSYALLISGGGDPSRNWTRYWGDVAMFYSTLRLKYNIPKENIVVCLSDGKSTSKDQRSASDGTYSDSPWDLDNDGTSDVNYSATKSNIQSAISSFASKLTADDQLFVFVTDHGTENEDTGDDACLIPWLGSSSSFSTYDELYAACISASELSTWLASIPCPTALAFEFCYSGCFVSSIASQPNRVIATACGDEVSSAFLWCYSETDASDAIYSGGYHYCNPWAWAFNAALRGCDSSWVSPWNDDSGGVIGNADTDGDGAVSIWEAAQKAESYILNTTKISELDRTLTFCDTPQYGESSNGYGKQFYVLKQGVSAPTIPAAPTVTLSGTTLSWTAVPGAKYYRVYRSFSPYGFMSAYSSWQTGTSCPIDVPTTPGRWHYAVKAASAASEDHAGDYSNIACARYAAGGDLSETPLTTASAKKTIFSYTKASKNADYKFVPYGDYGSGGSATLSYFGTDYSLASTIIKAGSTTTFGVGTLSASVSFPANTSTEPRYWALQAQQKSTSSTTYSYFIGGGSEVFYYDQKGVESAVLGNSAQSATEEGGLFTVDVTSQISTAWTLSCDKSWVTLTRTSGKGSATVAYVVEPNSQTSQRTATITIKIGSSTAGTLQITQAKGTATDLPDLQFVSPSGYDWPAKSFLSTSSTVASKSTSFKVGDPIYLYEAVGNMGEAATTKGFRLLRQVLDSSATVIGQEYVTIADTYNPKSGKMFSGKEIEVLQGLSAGQYTYRCIIDPDPDNAVVESDETNNTSDYAFTVTAQSADLPNLTFGKLSGWPSVMFVSKTCATDESATATAISSVQEGETVYVMWGVKNIGSVKATSGETAKCYLDGALKGTATAKSAYDIGKVRWFYCELDMTGVSVGEHTVKVCINPDKNITESNYADNEETMTITVESSSPSNDDFSGATLISGATGSTTGSNVGATSQSGEPLLTSYKTATTTVWWKWTAPSSGSVTIDTVASSFDTQMGVYTGSSLSALSLVKDDDDSGDDMTSVCTFDCTGGTTYYICVGGYNGKTGTINLHWSFTAATEKPDLAIVKGEQTWPAVIFLSESGATSASSSFEEGASVCFSFAVENIGNESTARTFGTRISILSSSGLTMHTYVYTNKAVVAAGDKAFSYKYTNWLVFSSLPKGSYTFKVEIDCHKEIVESNEDNNVAQYSFSITDKKTHSVKFELGAHGSRTSGGDLEQTVSDGAAATAPTVVAQAGYEFLGWDKTFAQVKSDLLVTAQYGLVEYTITYDNLKGATNPSGNPAKYTVEDSITFAALADVDDFEFTGWSPAMIAKGTTGNKTVTAQWKEKSCLPWPEPSENYENWQTIYAKVYDKKNKAFLVHADALLGAFDESGNCIGVASLNKSLSLFMLNAGFNGTSISSVTLKYWDPERGEIDLRPAVTLKNGEDIGLITDPQVFEFGDVTMEITLKQNYTWISIPLVLDDPSIVTVFADGGFANGDKIAAPGCSATYLDGEWYLSPETFVVKPGVTYVVRKSSSGSVTLEVSGSAMEAKASVVAGWNWLGGLSADDVALSTLVHSAGFADNDKIGGQGSGNTASYLSGDWYGMETLKKGVGYKFKLAKAGTLSVEATDNAALPSASVFDASMSANALTDNSETPSWSSPDNKENWQCVYAKVYDEATSQYLAATGSKLAAFDAAGNCIGVATVTAKLSLFMLNVGFDGTTISGVTLKYWDSERGIVDIDATLTLKANEDVGGITNPVVYGIVRPSLETAVSFDANGGSGAGDKVKAILGEAMPAITSKPVKLGYTFAGYFDQQAAGSGAQYYSDSLASVRNWDKEIEQATLFAHWVANTYTVRFYKNDGSGVKTDQSFTYDQTQNLKSNAFSWDGHTFSGWAESEKGVVKYVDGDFVKNLASAQGAVVPLYAVWDLNSYDWQVGGKNMSVKYGDKVSLSPDGEFEGIYTNISCVGWNGTGDVANGVFDPDAENKSLEVTVTQPSTVTWLYETNFWFEVSGPEGKSISATYGGKSVAVSGCWLPDGAVVSVTVGGTDFEYWSDALTGQNLGEESSLDVTVHGRRKLVARFMEPAVLSALRIDGPEIVNAGHSEAYTCTAIYSDKSEKSVSPSWTIESGEEYASITADGLLTASAVTSEKTVKVLAKYFDGAFVQKYKTITIKPALSKHTVTFVLGTHGKRADGVALEQTVSDGAAATAPAVVAQAGYEFLGWDKTFAQVKSDLVVTAQYGLVEYTITYDNLKGATNPSGNPAKYTVEDSITFAALADVDDFEFSGWSPAMIAKGTTGNKTVTAQWLSLSALTWYSTKESAFATATASGKRVLLVCGRDKCAECVRVRDETCNDEKVKAKLQLDYVLWYCDYDDVKQRTEASSYLASFSGSFPWVAVIDVDLGQGIVGATGYLDAVGMLEFLEMAEKIPFYGRGKSSEFSLSAAMGGGAARIVGVANLTAEDFTSTLYKGNTWALNGKPPTENHYYLCFTGDANLIDAEKDSVYNNKDDYWCSEFTDLNLAYYGGWIPKSQYATVDAAAKALRNSYKADECVTFDWVNGKLKSFGLEDKGDVKDYVVPFEGSFYEDEFHEFLAEQFDGAQRLVYLNAMGHAVTCCGYSVDEDDLLNGLFIIDSDNDMFNGGAEKSPNRIMFCPVVEDEEWGLMIANIFAEEWTPLVMAYALKSVDEASDPKAVFDANGGWVEPSEKTLCLGEPFGALPTPERTGYSFAGWWNEAYGTVTEDTVVTQNGVVTLSAQWQAHVYDVRFDANGGEGEMVDLTGLIYDTQSTLPKCSFVHDDETKKFRGWALTPEGKVAYRGGAKISNLTDEDGATVTLYAVWASVPDGFAFETCETATEKGGTFVLTVYGGSDEAATSVKVNVTYGSAKAADLVLKNATVEGENGVEQKNIKLPLTLTWAKGDTTPKVITIPTAAGKTTDAPKALTWNLTDAKGLGMADMSYCIGTIEAGEGWNTKDVYVLPYVADVTGGKVSGGASVKPDAKSGAYKAVTLKATANKGYWFAGWYDVNGDWVSGDLSFKVTPNGLEPLSTYEARFVPAQTGLCGTYNGYARLNLKGMTVVKNAVVSDDVYGEYAFTATLSTAGKVSGSVTVGGKKITLKADSVYERGAESVVCLVTADEKALFGVANSETLMLIFGSEGMAELYGWESVATYTPLSGQECYGYAYKDVSKDKTEAAKLSVFSGTYAGVAMQADGGVVPVSIVVDKTGKVKLAGKYADGTALSASGSLGGYRDLGEHGKTAELELVMTPKALGGGAYHLTVSAYTDDAGVPSLTLFGYTAVYTEKKVEASSYPYSLNASLFTTRCWIPTDEDLADVDFGAVRLTTGDDVIDILYAAKNGTITGLGSTLQTGYTVKFDAKTGLFTVAKGKTYTVQGVLGDYDSGCYAAGRINADGSLLPVSVEHVKLPEPEENFPWEDNGFSLTVGQSFAKSMQASVTSDGTPLELTITGLPSGLKYDKKTGLITGAATKAATSTVKVSYKFGSRTITRTTKLVVAPKPAKLPQGTYAGFATVRIDGVALKPVDCPFTATIDKNGALSGSVTVFGKKATFKAAGYGYLDDGYASYAATLDLKAVNKQWETADFELAFEGDSVVAGSSGSFGTGHAIVGVEALRNQTKDADYATLAVPYLNGSYLLSCETTCGEVSAVTVLSVTVDKKGGAKVAGTFVDGTAFSASSTLCVSADGETATVLFPVTVKSLGAGGMALGVIFYKDEDGVTCSLDTLTAAKYSLTDGEYAGYSFPATSSYRYSSRVWVDEGLDPDATCLAVSCANGAFEEARFAWATKTASGVKQITGVGKKLSGPSMTIKIDDKTGLFSGTCGKCKIFGTMDPGVCSGAGTVVDKDGSIGKVIVRPVELSD